MRSDFGRPLPFRDVAEEAHEARPPLVRQASADDVHVDRAPVLVQATEIGDLRQAALRALRERRQILRHVLGRMNRLDAHAQQFRLAVAQHPASGRIDSQERRVSASAINTPSDMRS